MYQNSRALFKNKLQKIISEDVKSPPLFDSIFKLNMLLNPEKNTKKEEENNTLLAKLFLMLGAKTFTQIITLLKGSTLTFPTEDTFQDYLMTSLCYYYKEVEGLNWTQIKTKINQPSLNTIKYGIKVRQLKYLVDTQLTSKMKGLGITRNE